MSSSPPAPAGFPGLPAYAELHCRTNFSFQVGASHAEELVARAHALMRRLGPGAAGGRDDGLTVGPFEISLSAMTVRRDGELLALSSREFALLAALARSVGRPLSRAQLIDRALGRDADVTDRAIDVQVARLRRAIGDDATDPRYIRTVWGVGYVLTPGAAD